MSDISPGIRFQDPLLGNSSPWIYVCSMWALVACTIFVSIRLWVRRLRYGLDDAICLLSFLSAAASCSTILSALSGGLGAPTPATDYEKCSSVAALIVSSICLLLLADGLSKCSTILLVVRIISSRASPLRFHRMVCWIAIGITTIWVAVSLGIYAGGCTRQCVLDPDDSPRTDCQAKGDRFIAVAAIGSLIEAVIFILATFFFGTLQMSWKTKSTTLILFAVRLPLVALSVIFTTQYSSYIHAVDHGLPNVTSGIYWQLALLSWIVISPCLQTLKSTIEALYTSGAVIDSTRSDASDSAFRLRQLSASSSGFSTTRRNQSIDARLLNSGPPSSWNRSYSQGYVDDMSILEDSHRYEAPNGLLGPSRSHFTGHHGGRESAG